MKKPILILIITLLTLSPAAARDENPEKKRPLTLDLCIQEALHNNPLILSSYQQHQASLARVNQAKALPQPSLDWDSDLQPRLFDFKGTGEWYFGISQSIEFPGKRYLRGRIAAKESQELMKEIELLKLDITYQVKQGFYGLLLAEEKQKYAEENLELSRDFLNNTQLKYETGDAARVEALRAQVEASRAAAAVRQSANEVRLAKAYLNYLMARRKYAPLSISGQLKKTPLPLNLNELKEKAFHFRPELRSVRLAQERLELQKKQSYMNYLPDFDLGVSRHKVMGEGEWWDVTLSFPIPLFFWQPAKGEMAEVQANARSLSRENEHLENTIILEVEEAYMNAESAEDQIQMFEEEILSQAEEVYQMFLFSYQEGEIEGIELIDARRTLLEARTSYADALFNYGVALAALEKSIGTSLEGDK
ncbi:MAG: TolC family protein [Candidatus Aminicenantaceae bacterium]